MREGRRAGSILGALLPVLTAVLLAVVVAGCTSTSVDPVEQNPEGFAGWVDTVPHYRIGPGDRLSVTYLRTPEVNQDVLVLPDGRISLMTTGSLDVMDLSVDQITDLVADRSQKVLRNPVVAVAVTEATSAKIYVGGSVARPGAYDLKGRIGAMEAVDIAGGFNDDAHMAQAILIRRSPADRPMLRLIDLQSFLGGGDAVASRDVPLYPGDILFIPRSSIGEVNLWIEQFINRVLPFSRSFSYTINRGTGAVQ